MGGGLLELVLSGKNGSEEPRTKGDYVHVKEKNKFILLRNINTLFSFEDNLQKHTPFAIESITNNIVFSDKNGSCVIARNGDLINSVSLDIWLPILPVGYEYPNNLGYKLIEFIEFRVANDLWDKMTGEFMMIYEKITKEIRESSSLFISDNSYTLKKWSNKGNSTLEG